METSAKGNAAVCRHWLASGSCWLGSGCKFRHDSTDKGSAGLELKPSLPCKVWATTGVCIHGSRCRFIHDRDAAAAVASGHPTPSSLPSLPTPPSSSGPCESPLPTLPPRCDSSVPSSGEKMPCKFWATKGSCIHGSRCRFSHDGDAGAAKITPTSSPLPNPPSCSSGDSDAPSSPTCESSIPGSQKLMPCKFWAAKGSCIHGSSCRFRHDGAEAPAHATPTPAASASGFDRTQFFTAVVCKHSREFDCGVFVSALVHAVRVVSKAQTFALGSRFDEHNVDFRHHFWAKGETVPRQFHALWWPVGLSDLQLRSLYTFLRKNERDVGTHLARGVGLPNDVSPIRFEVAIKRPGAGAQDNWTRLVAAETGRTNLHKAAIENNAAAVYLLVSEDGCSVNTADVEGMTALHFTVNEKKFAFGAISALIDLRANVNLQNRKGFTPLGLLFHHRRARGRWLADFEGGWEDRPQDYFVQAVKLLIDAGSNPLVCVKETPEDESPLQIALALSKLGTLRDLVFPPAQLFARGRLRGFMLCHQHPSPVSELHNDLLPIILQYIDPFWPMSG